MAGRGLGYNYHRWQSGQERQEGRSTTNAKSITDSQLDGAHVGLIFTCKCVMWASFMCEIHEGEVAHKSESR